MHEQGAGRVLLLLAIRPPFPLQPCCLSLLGLAGMLGAAKNFKKFEIYCCVAWILRVLYKTRA